MIEHPFQPAWNDSLKCDHWITASVTCDRPPAEHRTTAAPDRLRRQVREPVHPRETEVYQATTRVGGIDVAVDEAGCLVLHVVQPGAYTITNLDGFVADLELARQHAKRYALRPVDEDGEIADDLSYEEQYGERA